MSLRISEPGDDAKIPNPGSAGADPRLTAALLTRFQAADAAAPAAAPELPGATVRFPIRDPKSLFFGLRQFSSPFTGAPSCTKWTAGMWATLTGDFAATPGVQLAISRLGTSSPPPGPDAPVPQGQTERQHRASLAFSEAIITAPPQILTMLADDRVPGGCSRLTDINGKPGRIQPLPVPPVGDRTWAYRIVGATGYTWHWVQVVRFGNHLIEIRIPNQEPGPHGDMVSILRQIAAQAHAKAARTLT